jgi:hypothetical protein
MPEFRAEIKLFINSYSAETTEQAEQFLENYKEALAKTPITNGLDFADYHLSFEQIKESVFTCEHCGDGLATETLSTTEEKVCPDCLEFLNPERSRSWDEMADLTHISQVRIFGWCGCEDSTAPYDDCPKTESEKK